MPRMNRTKLLAIMQQHPDIFGQVLSDIEVGGNPAPIVRLINIIDREFQETDLEFSFPDLTEDELREDDIKVSYTGDPRPVNLEDALCYIGRIVTKVSVGDHPAPQSLTLQGLVMFANLASDHTDRTAFIIRLFNPMYQIMLGMYAQDGSNKTIIRKPPAAARPNPARKTTLDEIIFPNVYSKMLAQPSIQAFNQIEAGDVDETFDLTSHTKKNAPKDLVRMQIDFLEMRKTFHGLDYLTHFDRDVYLAAWTLYLAGNRKTSATAIYHAMNGNNSKVPSSQEIAAIMESVQKMSVIRTVVGHVQDDENWLTNSHYLLEVDFAISMRNGVMTTEIIFKDEPYLARYSREKGQYTTYPIALQNYPGTHNQLTRDIHDYLMNRIAHMKYAARKRNRTKTSNKILFASLMDCTEAPIGESDRAHRRQRKAVFECEQQMLQFLVEQRHIKGFKFDDERNVQITL